MNSSTVPSEQPTEAGEAAPFAGQDLYRLLELTPFESNPSVIASKVRELMRETRKYQLGLYAARTQSRMEEIAAATARLLDPHQKQVYDEELRRHYGMPPVSVASTYAGIIPEPLPSTSASVKIARGAGHGQRMTLVLLVIAVVALIAWGFRALAPQIPLQATPVVRSPRPGPPVVKSAVVKSTAAMKEGAVRTTAVTPKRGVKPNDTKLPVAAKNENAVSDARPPTIDPDPFITAIQEIVADQSGIAAPERAASEPLGEQSSRQGAHGNSSSADKPTASEPADARRASPSKAANGATGPRPVAVSAPARQKQPVANRLHLAPAEVLRELRDVRLKRTPAQRLSPTSQSLGSDRVVELVQYARTAFDEDLRFQRQLDQEVAALKRVYPQLRDLLPDPAR